MRDSTMGKASETRHNRRMLRPTTGQFVVVALGLLTACSSKTDTPALAHCTASDCNPNTLVSSGQGTSGADSGSSTLGVSLSVSVVGFNGGNSGSDAWSTSNAVGLGGNFTVSVPLTDGTVYTNTGPSPTPLIANVLVSDQASWVAATPPTGSAYLPGMRGIPSNTVGSISVPLLQISDLDAALAQLLLQVDPTQSAQVVVKVIDPTTGGGLAGVRAQDMSGTAMAYANSGAWINATTNPTATTDSSGLIMAISLSASTSSANSQPTRSVLATIVGVNPQGLAIAPFTSIPIENGFVSYGTVLFQ